MSEATVYVTTTLPDGKSIASSGITGTDGKVTLTVKSRLTGMYTSSVTNVTHETITYDPSADAENSDSHTVL